MKNVTILLAVVAMLAGTAQAGLTIYEGFNYTDTGSNPNQQLDGIPADGNNHGASGFAAVSDWDDYSSAGYNGIMACPHTGGGLDSNAFPFTAVGSSATSTTNDYRSYARRELATHIDTSAAGEHTYYISLLTKTHTVGSGMAWAGLGTGDRGEYNQGLFFATNGSNTLIKVLGTSGYVGSADRTTDGSTYFVVMKFITNYNGGTDTWGGIVSYGPSETVPTSEPTSWDATATSSSDYTLDYLYMEVDVPDSKTEEYDEFRVGTTWNDVAVPEPATMVLLGLGGIGVLIRRKRR